MASALPSSLQDPGAVVGEDQPITALPLFNTLALYGFADGKVLGADVASHAVTMPAAEVECHSRIFSESARDLPDIPIFCVDNASEASKITLEAFKEQHLDAFVPALVRGAAATWPALEKWDFDFFANAHGDLEVEVTVAEGKRRTQSLKEYIAEVRSTADEAQSNSRNPQSPPYLRGWYYERDLPELAADLWSDNSFHSQAFKDWFKKLPAKHHPDFHWLFIGGAHAPTPMHVDPTATHAWLTQIYGRKRFTLFPPCDLASIQDPGGGLVNPEEAKLRGAAQFQVILHPGDTLFVPAWWAHHVECLDESISVTWNFLGELLFPVVRSAYLAHQVGFAARSAALRARNADDKDHDGEE